MLDHPMGRVAPRNVWPQTMMMDHVVSPLEYSAMLKLHSETGDREDEDDRNHGKIERKSSKGKPSAIPLRMVGESSSGQGPIGAGPWSGTKNTAKEIISRFQSSSTTNPQVSQQGGYSRVSTQDDEMDKSEEDLLAIGQPASLFSSSPSSESEHEGEKLNSNDVNQFNASRQAAVQAAEHKQGIGAYRYPPSKLASDRASGAARDESPEFRWDGSRIDKQKLQQTKHEEKEKVRTDKRYHIGIPPTSLILNCGIVVVFRFRYISILIFCSSRIQIFTP